MAVKIGNGHMQFYAYLTAGFMVILLLASLISFIVHNEPVRAQPILSSAPSYNADTNVTSSFRGHWSGTVTLHVVAVALEAGIDSVGSGIGDPYVRAAIGMDWNRSQVYPESLGQRYGPMDVFTINWQHTWVVDTNEPQVLVYLQLWDYDSGVTGDTNVDIDPNGGRDLELYYNLYTGTWSGDTSTDFSMGEVAKDYGAVWFYITSDPERNNFGYLDVSPMTFTSVGINYTVGQFNLQSQTHPLHIDSAGNTTIVMRPPSGSDFDLYLYKGEHIITWSRNTGDLDEKINTFLEPGDYSIVVKAESGSGTYQLRVNDDTPFFLNTDDVSFTLSGGYIHRADAFITSIGMLGFDLDAYVNADKNTDGLLLILLENIDPDMFIITNYDRDFGLHTGCNSILMALDIHGPTSFSLYPFFVDKTFYFIDMGDNRPGESGTHLPGGQLEQPEVFKEIFRQSNMIQPQFILDNGDLVDGLGVMDISYGYQSPVTDEEYYYFRDVVWNHTSHLVTTVGNHDVSRGADDACQHDGEEIYEDFLQPKYYTFNYGNTHFINLDTYEDENHWWNLPNGFHSWGGYIKGDQYNWMVNDLKQTDDMRQIPMFHIPILPVPGTDESNQNEAFNDYNNRAQVLSQFLQHNVSMMFCSHAHTFADYYDVLVQNESGGYNVVRSDTPAPNSVECIVTGGAGAELEGDDWYHYLLVKVSPDGISYLKIYPNRLNISYTISKPNDGTETENHITITNQGEYNLPYVRIKMLMNPKYAAYKAEDEVTLEPIKVHSRRIGDHTVVYVDAESYKGTTRNIKVYPADTTGNVRINSIGPFVDGKEYAAGQFSPYAIVENTGSMDEYNIQVRFSFVKDGETYFSGCAHFPGPLRPDVSMEIDLGELVDIFDLGSYTFTASLVNFPDDNESDNIVSENFTIMYRRDLAVTGLSVADNSTLTPGIKYITVTVENTGTVPETPTVYFRARYQGESKDREYATTTSSTSLGPLESMNIRINHAWTAYDQGRWNITAGIIFASDSNPENNVIRVSVMVDKAPTISNLYSDPGINSTWVNFTTDEPTIGSVRYSTHFPLDSIVTESEYTTDHAILLTDLAPDTTYFFEVDALDMQGNMSTSDNAGHSLQFTTLPEVNHMPVFTGIQVLPDPTYAGQDVTFTVTVMDPDGDSLKYVWIYLDGEEYTMKEKNGSDFNTKDGKTYYYETELDEGTHTYSFETYDWHFEADTDRTYQNVYSIVPFSNGPASGHTAKIGHGSVSLKREDNFSPALAAYNLSSTYDSCLWYNITISLDPSDLEGYNTSTVHASLYHNGSWINLPWEVYDANNSEIHINTSSPGIIGIFASPIPADNNTPPDIINYGVKVQENGTYLFFLNVSDSDMDNIIAFVTIDGNRSVMNLTSHNGTYYNFFRYMRLNIPPIKVVFNVSDGRSNISETMRLSSPSEPVVASPDKGDDIWKLVRIILYIIAIVSMVIAVLAYVYLNRLPDKPE